jgi:hypothetical protein
VQLAGSWQPSRIEIPTTSGGPLAVLLSIQIWLAVQRGARALAEMPLQTPFPQLLEAEIIRFQAVALADLSDQGGDGLEAAGSAAYASQARN